MSNVNALASPATVFASRLAERVTRYRQIVAKVAAGGHLTREDDVEAGRAMKMMGLPDSAFRRDVRAWRLAGTADESHRAELAWNHPHLFDDAEGWAKAHIRSVERMRSRGGR